MEWEVEEDRQQPARSAEEAAPWVTTLRLSTPRLGSVEARLRISGNSLQLNLSTPVGASAADMRDELPILTAALADAGISLQSAQVRHEPE
jgi:flagellar hook-length control protein FliK